MSRSNPWKQQSRQIQHTTLVVVEGDTESCFIKHLKILCGRNRGTRLTIENAHGGSGDNVLKKSIGLAKNYEVCLCLYDYDRRPTIKTNIKKAKSSGIIEIISVPSIEGLLLEILGEKVPHTTNDCKRKLKERLGGSKLTKLPTFEKYFPKNVIESRRHSIPSLDLLYGSLARDLESS